MTSGAPVHTPHSLPRTTDLVEAAHAQCRGVSLTRASRGVYINPSGLVQSRCLLKPFGRPASTEREAISYRAQAGPGRELTQTSGD